MMRGLGLALIAATLMAGQAKPQARLLDWADLHGWASDDHAQALAVFNETCGDLTEGDWPAICAHARETGDPRTFFETFFRPVLLTDDQEPLFTGYYEPELPGARHRTDRFSVPLYRRPDDAPSDVPWLTRQELETSGILEGRELEIAWLEDPVDKFFLQVQGSGRIRLPNGESLRVGYGGKNGHSYRSVGKELIRRGLLEEHQVSAQAIRKWVRENPVNGPQILWHNPSYVFFREVTHVPAEKGPLGAMNRSITAMRTIAVDPEFVPLGAPVWLEKDGARPLRRLMVAQDTGSAVTGPQRAEIFYGTGDEAGELAGRVRDGGRLVMLLPIRQALTLTDGN